MNSNDATLILTSVIDKVSEITGVPPSAIVSKGRFPKTVRARAMVYIGTRTYFDLTLAQIAGYFGNTHASVIHAMNMVEHYASQSLSYKRKLDNLTDYLKRNRDKMSSDVVLRERMEFLQEQLSV